MNFEQLFAHLRARELRPTVDGLVPVARRHAITGRGADALASRLVGGQAWAGIERCEDVILVDVRGTYPGLQDRAIASVQQVPLYFSDVVPFQACTQEVLDARLRFVRDTGFLPVAKGEVLAVVWAADLQPWKMCHVYEHALDGTYREVYDKPWLSDRATSAKRIADLDQTATRKAMEQVNADILYALAAGHAWRADVLKRTRCMLREHAKVAPPERTESGAVIERSFLPESDVTTVFPRLRGSEGWRDYPTGQSASYYGTWVNPRSLQTASFAEGDFALVTCASREQFWAELKGMALFHGPRRMPCATGYGSDGTTVFVDSLSLLEGAVMVRFETGEPARDARGNWNPPLWGFVVPTAPSLQHLRAGAQVPLHESFFQLDLLDPRAFENYQAQAVALDDGGGLRIEISLNGRVLHAHVPVLASAT